MMHENIIRIKAVAQCLKSLNHTYVFVGGAIVSLYATQKALAAGIRPTDDVDIVVELATYADHTQMEERLRSLGFINDVSSGVICRYTIHGIIVDIMPTDSTILGFSNRWYAEGFNNAVPYTLDEETVILIFSLPYFLASKWEAHKSRGGDLRTSRDFEDMVYIFEHCKNFDDQLLSGPQSVRQYLIHELFPILNDPDFEEGLYGHLENGTNAEKLIVKIKAGLGLPIT